MCDEAGVLTWAQCSRNEHVNSNTELCGGNCIQDAGDPLVLPRYRVSSVMVRVSELVQVYQKRQTFESGKFGHTRESTCSTRPR